MFPRKFFAISLAVLIAVSLTGCMNTGKNQVATPGPTIMAAATAAVSAMPSAFAQSAYDWQTGAQNVENAIMQLSEVSDARVLVAGNTALVGVKFNEAYKGEMTERIREMIAGVVKQADPSIQTVAVTAQDKDVTEVYTMSDKVRGGERLQTYNEDILAIVRNATTMR
jgi:YhcN/YlaJ family sporulation lipoprotein